MDKRLLSGIVMLAALAGPISVVAKPAADTTLPRVARVVTAHAPLIIVAFGSSSTEGVGALTKAGSYPSRLQADLAARLPAGETVTVINRGVGGDNIDDMARRVDRDVVALHPDLVIWQLGSNDALGRVPLDHFMAVARADLARIRAGGADVMLMEPQDCPVLQAVAGSSRYRDAVRELGADFAVPVINRYDMMAGWLKAASVPLLAADGLHMSDAGYARLAEAVATEIMTDAGVGRSGLTAAVK